MQKTIEEVLAGDFTHVAYLIGKGEIFAYFNDDVISAIISGCSTNGNTKMLYLVFLEVKKILNLNPADCSLEELKDMRSRVVNEMDTMNYLEYYHKNKEFFEKWFEIKIQEKRYSKLMQQIFKVAYCIYEQNKDIYAEEIVEYICTSKKVEERKLALFNIKDVSRFIDDEDVNIANIARKINEVNKSYEELPLDGKLLIDLIEEAFQNGFINYNREFETEKYRIFGSLFKNNCILSLPDYYFKMSNHKMISYRIYEAIIAKELEFDEEKTPIFYSSLISNNPKRL